MQETPVWFLGQVELLEQGKATHSSILGASLVAQLVKNPPAMWETWVRSLGWEDNLEKGKATHSSILPEEFHGLYRLWGRKELDTTEQLSLSFLFTIFTGLSNHHHCLMIEHGYCPQKKAPTQERSHPHPSPWQPLFHFCPYGFAYSGYFM